MACTTVTVSKFLDQKIDDAINQIRYKRKQHPDTKGIHDYLIKAYVFVNITVKALEERIRTL